MPKASKEYYELEGPLCDVSNMTELCLIAADHAATKYVGIPESEYLKVTRENWALLHFALCELQDKAQGLKTALRGI